MQTNQKVSMTDIARRVKVSQATVSYVLNGREGGLVGKETRRRVLEAAQEMGYRRNRAAQALAGQSSHLIELCVNGFHPAFYSHVLEAFDQQLRSTPYELHIVNPAVDNEKEWTVSSGGWPVDGVIMADASLPPTALPELQRRGVPTVAIGVYPNTTIDHVFVDLNPALLAAMRHLASHRQRVAYVSLWPAHTAENPDPRYPIYRQVMQEAGLNEEIIMTPEWEGISVRQMARETVRDYITKNGCPEAIFCFNDERAIGTLAALRDLDFRVPQDVMLIGCDGIEETAYHYPAISTIQFPFHETARLAWEFLSRRMKEPDIPLQSATLTTQLLLRDSSAP